MASGAEYAELQAMSNFSFLEGGSHPEEIIGSAATHGYRAISIADKNSLAGIVRAHTAAKEHGIQFIPGARIECSFDSPLPGEPGSVTALVHPLSRIGYGNLCRLLTTGKLRAPKGECLLSVHDIVDYQKDLSIVLIPSPCPLRSIRPHPREELLFHTVCSFFKERLLDRDALSVGLTRSYQNNSLAQNRAALESAEHLFIPLIALGDICYHTPERRPLQDLLTCIRHHTTIHNAGFLLAQNSERYLKTPAEMVRLFRDIPSAIRRGIEIAERARFSLDELRYEYPGEICPAGDDPLSYLTRLTMAGAYERYPHGIPDKVEQIIKEELVLIHELAYEKYFLTCYDIVSFARKRGILCQGRGAAANSAVCYCLGITSVDPDRIDLLFARFVSKERNEPPDIDIDFEHERREEVIQYIYEKYGRSRAGLTCEVVTYRHRSAVREVGKAMGLPLEMADNLAKLIHRWNRCVIPAEDMIEAGLNPHDTLVQTTLALAGELLSFPRHLSQHVGGFIISEKPLIETVPILNASMEDRTIIEWNKDDIEALGMLKIDILALGMLTCIRKALDLVGKTRGAPSLELHTIPAEDPEVYDMLCKADTVGVFQIESRAQMSMLPRLKPRCFYDLVIEVAIVRPGPIQGNMVHPFLRRRSGIETVSYPDKRVEDILGKTMGVPIFQEQAMRLAIILAQFSPGEAEKLRRAMAAWKRNKEAIAAFEEKIVTGMTANGYSVDFAKSCINQIKGFSEYGFPESHAASFALLVYASSWLKCHYPAQFAVALINSQPMGFYSPSQIISDAEKHGVPSLPIDINESVWDCTITDSPSPSIRLGLRLVKGLHKEQAELISELIHSAGRYSSIRELYLSAWERGFPLRRFTLTALARTDAFNSMERTRREALWEIKGLPPEPLPLDPRLDEKNLPANLPQMTLQQSMFDDYAYTGFSLKAHPMTFLREKLVSRRAKTAAEIRAITQQNLMVAGAGIAICRQRPHTARGTVFITLEDETGTINLIIRGAVFERFRKEITSSKALLAYGKFERAGEVTHINVRSLESLDGELFSGDAVAMPGRSYSY